MKFTRLLILFLTLLSLSFGKVNIDSNKCALIVKFTSSKNDIMNFINNHYTHKQRRNITIYKTYNNKYAISFGLVSKYKETKVVNYLRNKGIYIPQNYRCLDGDSFKEEVYLYDLIKEQINLRFANKGPSFNCNYAKEDVEKEICSSKTLSTLDKINAFVYKNLEAILNRKHKYEYLNRLHLHEKNWVEYRNKKCKYKGYECIYNTYINHIEFLLNKLKNSNSLYITKDEATLDSYEYNNNKRYVSSESESNSNYTSSTNQTYVNRSSDGDCGVKAIAVCSALQYGCSKAAANADEEKRYQINLGCDYISNGLKMSREDVISSVFGTYVSNQAEKQEGAIGGIFEFINIFLKIQSWATCVNKMGYYLRRNNYCH